MPPQKPLDSLREEISKSELALKWISIFNRIFRPYKEWLDVQHMMTHKEYEKIQEEIEARQADAKKLYNEATPNQDTGDPLSVIKKDPTQLKFLKSPSERVILEAVSLDPRVAWFIDVLPVDVQEMLATDSLENLAYIKQITRNVKWHIMEWHMNYHAYIPKDQFFKADREFNVKLWLPTTITSIPLAIVKQIIRR